MKVYLGQCASTKVMLDQQVHATLEGSQAHYERRLGPIVWREHNAHGRWWSGTVVDLEGVTHRITLSEEEVLE